jgi:hypothetical protein
VAGQVLSLQQLQQQQQLGSQKLQEGDLQLQQQKQQMADQATMRQALLDSKGDMDTFQRAIVGKVSPSAMFQVNQTMIAQRKALADAGEAQAKLIAQHHDDLAGLINSVIQAPPQSKNAAWSSAVQQAQARNLLDPGMQLDPTKAPNDEDLTVLMHGNMLNSQQAKQASESANAAAATARAAAATK